MIQCICNLYIYIYIFQKKLVKHYKSTLAIAANITVSKKQASSTAEDKARNHTNENIQHDHSNKTLQEKTK